MGSLRKDHFNSCGTESNGKKKKKNIPQ